MAFVHQLLFVLTLFLSRKVQKQIYLTLISIAISSLLGKILDHIIIVKQSEALKTSNYQFGFKENSSTVLFSTMFNDTVQYYNKNGARPVYVLLLDATKAFDKVAFDVLFNVIQTFGMFVYTIKHGKKIQYYKYALINFFLHKNISSVIILCVLRLQSYYTTCVQIKSVA